MTVFTRAQTAIFLALMALGAYLLYPSEYTRGLMHRDTGDRTRAIAFFRDYLRRHPGHKGATLQLAATYEAGGRPDEALPHLLEFYRGRRGDLEAGKAVVDLLTRTGRDDRAAEFRWELASDLQALPAPPRAALEALLYQAFNEAASRQDDDGVLRALAGLAALADRGTRSAEAEGHREAILRLLLQRRRLGPAIEMLREAARRRPNDPEARRTIARVLKMDGRPDEALSELAEAIRAIPGDVQLRADELELLLSAKRWPEAVRALRGLMALQPAEPAWPRELARCFMESGRHPDAVRVLEGLVAKAPGEARRWWDLIYAFSDRDMHAPAIERLRAYLERFPNDENAVDALTHALSSLGRIPEAIDVLRARVAVAPSDATRRRALSSLLLEEERYPEAAEQFEALTRLEPAVKEHWLNLAYMRETTGDRRAAAKVLEAYLIRFPEDGRAVEQLSGLYVQGGERARAIKLLDRYVRPRLNR